MTTNVNSLFKSANEFLVLFEFDHNPRYEGVMNLRDEKVGFSVQRAYPSDLRYKPPLTKKGKPDTVALIYVIYGNLNGSTTDAHDLQHFPITIRIVKHNKYISQHYDYNFEDEECPTEESIRQSKTLPQPIGLDYIDDFYFSHETGKFIDHNKKQYSGIELLDKVFVDHCNTIHPIKGIKLRTKLKTQSGLVKLLSFLVEKILWLLTKVFGRTIGEEKNYSAFVHGYSREHFKKLSTESIDIFGYKASKSVIVLFSILVAVIYAIKYKFGLKSEYLENIASSTFLAPLHLIVLLWIMDFVVPHGIFVFLNWLIKLRTAVRLRRLRYP